MYRVFKYQNRPLYVRIVLFSILVLAALSAVVVPAASRPLSEAAVSLEPVFSLPGGYYDQDIQLEIDVSYPDAYAIFTADGSVPTQTTGTPYTHPIQMSAATPAVTVIRARAVLPQGKLGPVVSASYVVGIEATLPIISLIVDPGDLWAPDHGIYANPLERGIAWERAADITYVDRDRRLGFHIPAGIRIHGGAGRRSDKKSFRLYFRRQYGTGQLKYPLFADSTVDTFEQLVLHSGGQDWSLSYKPREENWTLIRNQLADALAIQSGGIAAHSQPAIVFLNGELWGIYQIRERLDEHFLADHLDIQEADILLAPHIVPGQVVQPERNEHWEHFLQYVETHDLADPASYAYIQSQIDVANFIDYNIRQLYTANTDWSQYNVKQFRPRVQGGRWHWFVTDTDSGFGANRIPPDSHVSTDMVQYMLTSMREDEPYLLLLQKLLENPAFLERFLSRTADLLNTTFAPQSVLSHINALAAELEPDIAYETVRWSSAVDWASNIEEMRDFARRRPGLVRQHLVNAFDLDGTVTLSFSLPAGGIGYVAVNGALIQDLNWSGDYFQGIPVRVVAAPVPGYRFAGWDPPNLPQTPVITLKATNDQTITPLFNAAGDDTLKPGDVLFGEYQMGQGDSNWFELLVMRQGGVDLRGWRVTDNDTKIATDEGSLIFADTAALARVPQGTTIRVVVSERGNSSTPQDDIGLWDRRMVLYPSNGNLESAADPGFYMGANDNLVLLAPGPTGAFGDDQGIAFVAGSTAVTPASFGVLADGVLPELAAIEKPPSLQQQDWLMCLFVVVGLAILCFYTRWTVQRTH
ncbi:MAG: CotH kinase family protein [Anaerolineae bacterium]|nr:CotH kinase family protein [Anaerolineae bacterium]